MDIKALIDEADRCRRLADEAPDGDVRRTLREMEAELRAEAAAQQRIREPGTATTG